MAGNTLFSHPSLRTVVERLLNLRSQAGISMTLLAVCPNSAAVLEAGVKVAAEANAPMLFAATLNQVDRDGGYTGWTPRQFTQLLQTMADRYGWHGPLYACLDHGGPWLKDAHTTARLSLDETMAEVRHSITACLEAGYHLLHIDPTVDRTLPEGSQLPVEVVVARTLDLIAYAEAERRRLGLPAVAYEVGTEEVHGGLTDLPTLRAFVLALRQGLDERGLSAAWPCFFVGQVGTDLHTTFFDPQAARALTEVVAPFGSLIKGHYTDGVSNPEMYPESGMGGANVGPEFTIAEYLALAELSAMEDELCQHKGWLAPSYFLARLQVAALASGRWRKWLQPTERGQPFDSLPPDRQAWLIQTAARYVWAQEEVVSARRRLYENLRHILPDPHGYVVERIAEVMRKYINAFRLFDANRRLGLY